jgi:hypothetical protein
VKYLIVCSGGTWNTPDQEDNGIPVPTNAVKLKNCLAPSAMVDGVRGQGSDLAPLERRRRCADAVGTGESRRVRYAAIAEEVSAAVPQMEGRLAS